MRLNFAIIRTLFGNEFRMILRDRRTIVTAILLPLVVMPLMLFASSITRKKHEQTLQTKTYHYAVIGENSQWVRQLITETRAHLKTGEDLGKLKQFKFEEITVTNAAAALNQGDVHFLLERPGGEIAPGQTNSVDAPSSAPTLRIVYRADRDDASTGVGWMVDALEKTRSVQRAELLQSRGFPVSLEKVGVVAKVDLASEAHSAGLALGKFITLFLLVFIFSGGAIVAIDILAGEKERGTLETLLTSSATRTEIIAAKHLVILTVAGFITAMQAVNLMVYVGFGIVPVSTRFAAAITPGIALLLLILFLPVAALISSALLLTSGFAKSYKEAQLYFLPLMVVGILPALAPMLPDLPFRSLIVLLPIANVAVAAREILTGSFDWPMIGLAWLFTTALAVWLTSLSVSFLSTEKLISGGGSNDVSPRDGAALFSRHVGVWFAVLWAVVWVVNSYTANADIRIQITVNLVVLFFGASLVMLWRYRLNPLEVFAFRRPKPMVWLGVLCGIPGGILTASGLARITNYFVPVSREALEEFSRAVIPEGVSLAQLIFFLAVMPGFFEEITFRGLLLHGLRRRLRPVALVVVVGLAFGIFHFALFRLPGTTFLGMLFGATTLLTGSIFPATLWPAGNTASGLIAEPIGIPCMQLSWPIRPDALFPACHSIAGT
ncbi:MAG: ABC transporter permease, partial [Akkermansiaceae bacterium]|nr:ABC transporter permease [Verrucomicrobiales bacterium]